MKDNIKKLFKNFHDSVADESNTEGKKARFSRIFIAACNLCSSALKYEDAAEFEARVAAKLALNPTRNSQPCPYGNSRTCTCECDSKHRSCVDNRLKWARLAVEAEMDAEHGNEA
jgi:hypothetical protein